MAPMVPIGIISAINGGRQNVGGNKGTIKDLSKRKRQII